MIRRAVPVSRSDVWRADTAGRPSPSDADVRRLADEIAPGAALSDLGGTMSLNVRLQPADLVLRVHQPFVSRPRLLALQEVRRRLAARGLRVAAPRPWRGAALFRCGGRWAELEPFLASERPAPTPEAYVAMFGAMGELAAALRGTDVPMPRPIVSTYGPPSSLLRWLPTTEHAVRGDPAAAATARRLRELVGRLRAQWASAADLPVQLVHGDIRLSNVPRAPDGAPVYFDFGFLARRPRVHELAYALSWILLRPDSQGTAEGFDWASLPRLVEAYERAAGTALRPAERRALAPYTAAVPLYLLAIGGFMPDPVAHVRNETRLTFLEIGEWLLAHPEAVLG
jgi:Ser/Thr protein kinase RdoA (MazF antagonist)